MEFNFNINIFFKDEITKVGSRLIPDGFLGDRREVQDCLSKISYILNVLGEKSAKAQGLQKVITSGEKLRNSDHVVYILIDPKGGSKGLGTVLGMLKMGVKHLYVFDAGGNNHEITTKCILDFYVHESKQRMGLGKKLFQYMLKEERVDPVHLAIDKPSSKFLSFLLKHYGLQTIIPQMNNFVVFEGFFSNRSYGEGSEDKQKIIPAGINSCGSLYKSGTSRCGTSSNSVSNYHQPSSAVNLNMSYYGRQALHKPVSTMGMILQHKPAPSQTSTQNGSPNGKKMESSPPVQEVKKEDNEKENEKENEVVINNVEKSEDLKKKAEEEILDEKNTVKLNGKNSNAEEETPTKAVPEKITPKASPVVSPSKTNPTSPQELVNKPKSRLNSQGHLDLKFYHSSLW